MAAHGVVGGAMSEALGGSFRDGFIAAVISAGVSGVTNALWGNTAFMQSREVWAVAGRTVMAGVVGGAASVPTGGKFAHAALTSAFLHLYNEEVSVVNDGAARAEALAIQSGEKIFLVNREAPGSAEFAIASGEHFWKAAEEMGGKLIDISKEGWQAEMYKRIPKDGADVIGVFDHGTRGRQLFGNGKVLHPAGDDWRAIVGAVKQNGHIILFGCNCANVPNGPAYIRALAGTASYKGATVMGGSTPFWYGSPNLFIQKGGGGFQFSSKYLGNARFLNVLKNYP